MTDIFINKKISSIGWVMLKSLKANIRKKKARKIEKYVFYRRFLRNHFPVRKFVKHPQF
jgi:hypothetical protein